MKRKPVALNGDSMVKKATRLAGAVGAVTDIDFELFASLIQMHSEIKESLGKLKDQWPYKTMLLRYEFILQRGRFFRPQHLPKGYRRRKQKQCFENSFNLALASDDLAYCDGFVMASIGGVINLPIEHGWCVTADGKVVDITFSDPGNAYFGVLYTPQEMAEADRLPISDAIIINQAKDEIKNKAVKTRKSG